MKIGIDARLYSESGIGRYIRNLLQNLQEIDKENEYYILLLKKDYDNLQFNTNFKKVIADFRWYTFAEQIKLPIILYKLNLDLVHFPHFNIPVVYNRKFIVTIHDLIHQKFSMQRSTTHGALVHFIKASGYRLVFWLSLLKSRNIITVSSYVKKDLTDIWSITPEKVEVTYEGVDENLLKIINTITKKETDQVLKKFNVKSPFIFYVGNAYPHKNVEGLIKAFLEVRKNCQYLQLVLAGHDHYFWKRIKKEYQHKDIIYTGQITDREMVAFYKSAKAYVFPSFEEGFGIPLLEAFACSCPVASSNRASLPEIGKDAAIYFDPDNLEDIKEKILMILNDQRLDKDLVEKGKKRAKQFSWKKLAEQTLNIYQNTN